MKSNQIETVSKFLKSRNIEVDQSAIEKGLPFCVNSPNQFSAFIAIDKKDDSVVLFSFLADFSKMELKEVFSVMARALEANSFKSPFPIRFAMDDTHQFLVAWTILENHETTYPNLDKALSDLFEHGWTFCKNNAIDSMVLAEAA